MTHDDDMLDEIARDEAWLASFATPPASAEPIARTKQAICAELARQEHAVRSRWHAWHGAAASAASILLAAGVVWYAAGPQPTRPASVDPAGESIAFAAEIEQALDAIADDEATSAEFAVNEEEWDYGGAELCDAMEAILIEDQTSEDNQTGARTPQRHQLAQEGRLG